MCVVSMKVYMFMLRGATIHGRGRRERKRPNIVRTHRNEVGFTCTTKEIAMLKEGPLSERFERVFLSKKLLPIGHGQFQRPGQGDQGRHQYEGDGEGRQKRAMATTTTTRTKATTTRPPLSECLPFIKKTVLYEQKAHERDGKRYN